MSVTKTLRIGLTVAASLVMLSACETTTPDEFSQLENDVASLDARLDAAEASSANAQAAASQCTDVCRATEEKAARMYQQSLRK